MEDKAQKSVDYSDLCFACGKKNPIGLKLNFNLEGQIARAEFTPTEFHQGWGNIIHGGIISTILDEAMSYATYFAGVKCVTASIEVRFKHPLMVGETVIVTAWIEKNARKYLETKATMTLRDGTLIAEGKSTQFVNSKW